jgi:predicted RNase H-like HicB family nuclease
MQALCYYTFKYMASKLTTTNQFKVIIEQDEDGYFVATVPALPGCHAQAKALPQLMVRTREAIKLCLDVAEENPRYLARIKQFAYQPTFVGVELVIL